MVNFTIPGATVKNLHILPDVPLTVTGDGIGFDGITVGAVVILVVNGFVVTTLVIVTIFCAAVVGTAGEVITGEVLTTVTFFAGSLAHPAIIIAATRTTIRGR